MSRIAALVILADLMRGGRHSRRTVARYGVSLPTADRFLASLLAVPGVYRTRESRTTWFAWRAPRPPRYDA